MRAHISLCLISLLSLPLCLGYGNLRLSCPAGCKCTGTVVNCKNAALTEIPRSMSTKTERLNLMGNNIQSIRKSDFQGFSNLKVLQLSGNQIASIEGGAFSHLINLKRLRLNKNEISSIPDRLFENLRKLTRLDLRQNRLQCIGKLAFTGLHHLKTLQLDKNQLTGLSKDTLKNMADLTKVSLTNNNLSMLPEGLFDYPASSQLKIEVNKNPMRCNCHLMWFHLYLSQRRISHDDGILCSYPPHLVGKPLKYLTQYDFQCSNSEKLEIPQGCGGSICSKSCACSKDGSVDCKQRKLRSIPDDFPADVTEINLKGNQIEIIPSKAFAQYPKLKKLCLDSNRISHIAEDAFNGLPNLSALYLNENEIKSIPPNLFQGLWNLRVLFLHGNKISCIAPAALQGLTKLYLLHLAQNDIKSLDKGVFNDQKGLGFLYLTGNPLICDCNLKWLSTFLQNVEGRSGSTSTTCASPGRMSRKFVRTTDPSFFKCYGNESDISKKQARCHVYDECPKSCNCSKMTVDCSGVKLKSLPDNIPLNTKELILKGNEIQHIPRDGILKKLKDLRKLDLSNNRLNRIDSLAFGSLIKLGELDLSNNQITQVDEGTLRGLSHLQILLLGLNKIKCLNNDTFNQTPALSVLKLNNNEIGCIMKDTFLHLRSLKTLSLENNRLRCNCHLNWMTQWLRKNVELLGAGELPTCTTPTLLANTPITSIDKEHFQCITNTKLGCNNGVAPCCSKDTISCHPRAYCPPNCVCEATVVRCVNQNLTEIPSDIPADTTELYLERNSIRSINASSLSHLTKLHTLILSYNGIKELNANIFSNLTDLRTLTLSFNKLKCIDRKAFAGLTELRALLLHSNDISTIPYGSFDDLENLNNIALSQNPFYCDCNIKWLNDLFRKRFLDNGIALCSAPVSMSLKSIYHSRPSDFVCRKDGSTDAILQKCNPCFQNPCQNQGQCQAIGYHDYQCTCRQPFHGKNCENRMNACFGEPCKNGGFCKVVDNFGNYKCVCPNGFSGAKCTDNINDCQYHQCQNGGICNDGVANYTCSCQPGYRGDFCEEKFTFCEDENPCENEGLCQRVLNGYQCICQKGWSGKNCELNIDDCKYNSCLNGATCVDEVNGYSCNCRPGYIGKQCQKFAWSPPKPVAAVESVCTYHSCQHGGRCINSAGSDEYQCMCQPGYGGKFCEHLHSVHFDPENSYAAYRPPSQGFLKPRGNFTLEIATNQSTGIIMYYGNENQFLALELFNGHLRISYSLGKGQDSDGYSIYKLNDRTKRRLELDVKGENVTLLIDGRIHALLRNQFPRDNQYLSVDAPIYIGGGPEKVLKPLSSIWRLRSAQGFGGCVSSAYINDEQINFMKVTPESANVHSGCATYNKAANPCSDSSLCKNGAKCVSRMHRKQASFKCLCKTGFSGKHCETKMVPTYQHYQYDRPQAAPDNSCRRVVEHMYVQDPVTKCFSKRKIKIRKCEGICSQDARTKQRTCCVPARYKKRRIRFRCINGAMYERRFKLIRKCSCSTCKPSRF